MKKIISLCLTTALLIASLYTGTATADAAASASAPSQPEIGEIEYLDNGDYVVTTITDDPVSPSDITTLATKKWKTSTKTKRYYNASNEVLWTAAIRATFWYDGSSSACTYDLAIATAPGSTWSIKSKSSSRSGSTATAKVTATHKGATLSQDYTATVKISCTKAGVVS